MLHRMTVVYEAPRIWTHSAGVLNLDSKLPSCEVTNLSLKRCQEGWVNGFRCI